MKRLLRPLRLARFRWKTRGWDRSHFPGCPVRYGRVGECLSPDELCAPGQRWQR